MFLVFGGAKIKLAVPINSANLRCIEVVNTRFVKAISAPNKIDNDRLSLIAIVEIKDKSVKCL